MRRLLADSAAIFWREALHYQRDRAYWVGQIVFPLAVVAYFGFGMNRVVELPTGASYASHLATGILILLVGSGAVGAGFSLIADRQSGFLRVLLIAPIARGSIVLGKLAARFVASLLAVSLLVAILAAFTPLRIVHAGSALVAVAAITAVFVALGIALATRLGRLESFRLFAALVTIPLYLFSGIFSPLATLPGPVRLLAYVNPITYGADLLRFGLLGVHEIPVPLSTAMLALLALGSVALAVAIFDRGTTS